MSTCRKYRNWMPEALYGELDSGSRRAFEAHVSTCTRCTSELAGLRDTLGIVNTRVPAEPPADFWDRVWPDFVARLHESEAEIHGRSRHWLSRRWVLNLAGATALVLLGIFIGRFVWVGPATHEAAPPAHPVTSPLTLDDRIDQYLERSKMLLWSVHNLKADDARDLDLTAERRLSRALLRETGGLKDGLRAAREDQLLDLVSQLEIILLQIANLREAHAPLGVELARAGIEQRALLFQINIEEMRRASQRITKQKQEREASTRRVG